MATSASAVPSDPHAVSLKVLRLSRPSLATQTPLPRTDFGRGLDIAPQASLAYADSSTITKETDEVTEGTSLPLTPLLTLPASFGAAYVGETFACTLCANYEGHADSGGEEGVKTTVSGLRIAAELQVPSPGGVAGDRGPTALELRLEGEEEAGAEQGEATVQKIVRHVLKDEGTHVLAVTVTYTETQHHHGDDRASGDRVRTFRKLYQFVAQRLVVVRSKISERKRRERDAGRAWVLEAQIENMGEAAVVLESVWVAGRTGVHVRGVDGHEEGQGKVLKPQDVEQVMFLLEEDKKDVDRDGGGEGPGSGAAASGRFPLAQLNVEWRSAMGERGSLTTGWLASRGK